MSEFEGKDRSVLAATLPPVAAVYSRSSSTDGSNQTLGGITQRHLRRKIGVLIIEPSEADALAMVDELQRGGYDLETERVSTASQLPDALGSRPWDLVLSDYILPGSGGLTALEMVRAAGDPVPFIFVSSSIGEDAAVMAIKAGASDFILKSNLARLVPAVAYELRETAARAAQRRVQEVLEAAQANFRTLVENSIVGIYAIQEGHFSYINPTMTEIFKQPIEELLSRRVIEFVHPEDRAMVEANIRARMDGSAKSLRYTLRILRGDGKIAYVEAHGTVTGFGGRPAILGVMSDITERKESEQQLREQARLMELAHDSIVVRDLEGRIRFVNPAAERLFGRSKAELIGFKVGEVLYKNPAQFTQITQELLQKGRWSGEIRLTGPKGADTIVFTRCTLMTDESGKPGSVLAISCDVTEKRRLEEQVLRAQRMEMIGELAGGVAHDLNNVLAPVLMGMDLLRAKAQDDASRRLIDTLDASTQRGVGIVRQILSFARGTSVEKTLVQLKHLIGEQAKICKDTFSPAIQIKTNVPATLWPVEGNPTQLHQVLMNLCVNARDAMPGGGILSITATNLLLDDHYSQMHPGAKPGPHVVVAVSDTGTGMAPHVLERIFDPFFTTKDFGKGTGLGLSTAVNILKTHNGWVTAYSELGRGTQFKVYLPANAVDSVILADAPPAPMPQGRDQLVLVVDDEETIRGITEITLGANGYRVLTASDGTEAVALFARHTSEIALVITDMAMPFMDGPATIRALQRMNPAIPMIAVSGLSDNAKVAEVAGTANVTFLSKPFTAAELLVRMDSLLAKGGGPKAP